MEKENISNKTVGDNGFMLTETKESENYSLYTTYRDLLLIGYGHVEALKHIGMSEDWYKKMAEQYENELKEDE